MPTPHRTLWLPAALLIALAAGCATAGTQDGTQGRASAPEPRPAPGHGAVLVHAHAGEAASDDLTTLDGIVRAFYDVVSVPAGEIPDRARDQAMHVPGARIRLAYRDAGGTPRLEVLTLDELYDRFYAAPSARPFFEREIHRVTHRFGSIAHVWSTYEAYEGEGGRLLARGISSIELYHDGQRWWITGWTDEKEGAARPLPPEYLPASARN